MPQNAPTIITTCAFKTPYGELLLGEYQQALCLCDWRYRRMRSSIDARLKKYANATYQEGTHAVLQLAKAQLEEYFSGKRTEFDVPLALLGSTFQTSVWQALLALPYGSRLSYRQLAMKLGREDAVRAVASANGANALSIFVPCHRVLGADGALTGYAGGLRAKAKLLALEENTLIT